jgi:alcohol dehydrogenase class IV
MKFSEPFLPKSLRLPASVLAAPGCVRRLWETVRPFGDVGLLVHGESFMRSGRLSALLKHAPPNLRVIPHAHEGGEPTLDQLDRLRSTAHAARIKWVAAIGGGSALDLGKACAGLVYDQGPAIVYHEGDAIPDDGGVPFVAVPTTAGTGSEATGICVLTNANTGVKRSFRHDRMMASAVLLDPELLEDAPRSVIAASGMDALVQAVESYCSRYATPFSRQLSLVAFESTARALLPTYKGNRGGCANLLQGSFLAGLALAQARLGLVHGLAHPLGSYYGVGHGHACAACLPAVLQFNAGVCAEQYDRLSAILGQPLPELVANLLTEMRLGNPFAGPTPDNIDRIVAEVLASGSTAANPRPVSAGDARRVLDTIFNGK